ncbi:MAG: TasA family protein [Actinomycetota bacterium]
MATKTKRWERIGLTAAVIAAAAAVLGVSSLALFTDSETVGSNAFGTGTLDLTASPTSAVFNVPAMAPGDEEVAALTIGNSGTIALRYAATSTTTENTLAGELDLTIKTGVTTCTTGGFDTDGSVIYGPGDLGNTTPIALFGDATQGADAGDRTLAASTNEVLCVRVALPLSATNASQGASTTATFQFDAEQTDNNP